MEYQIWWKRTIYIYSGPDGFLFLQIFTKMNFLRNYISATQLFLKSVTTLSLFEEAREGNSPNRYATYSIVKTCCRPSQQIIKMRSNAYVNDFIVKMEIESLRINIL